MDDSPTVEDCTEARKTAAACAGILSLPFADRNWKGAAGSLAGAYAGSSLDFQDHRVYQPGDDPRHINWQAYARTGSYSLKVFREEVRPIVDLIFDVTGSMFHGAEKKRRSLELFYFARESIARAGAFSRVHLAGGHGCFLVDPERLEGHRWIDSIEEASDLRAPTAPRLEALLLRPGSMRVWISDLLFPAEPDQALPFVSQGGGRTILLCPFARAESDPEWKGDCRFVEVESGEERPHRMNPEKLAAYLRAYRNHFSLWEEEARRRQVALARIESQAPFADTLLRSAASVGAVSPL